MVVEKQVLDVVNAVVAELLDLTNSGAVASTTGSVNPLQDVKLVKEKLAETLESESLRVRLILTRLKECLELSVAATSSELDVPLHAIEVGWGPVDCSVVCVCVCGFVGGLWMGQGTVQIRLLCVKVLGCSVCDS